MELGYAFLLLLSYVLLALLGIWFYERRETRKQRKQPLKLPILTDREKRLKLNELLSVSGFAYDGGQDIFYSRMDSWQRKFGYGCIYDEAAATMNMVIDCEPIYFDYDNKKWMIEFWKGQYGITTGAEVGVYYLPDKALTDILSPSTLVYRCVEDEDTLRIQMVLWKEGKNLFFRRGYHWWLTGFSLGEFSHPKELSMDIEITLKDEIMRNAFLTGLHKAGYTNEELNVKDNTVWIHFDRPHTVQPATRTRLFSAIKQMENKRNVKLYQKTTQDYTNVYDKLLALQQRAPGLYRKWEQLGKSRFLSGEQ